MKRILDWTPVLVIAYAIYGLVFRPRFVLWGLPSTWWFVMGGVLAFLILLLNFFVRKDQ